MDRFQTSLEYVVFVGLFIVGGMLVFRILYGSPGHHSEGALPLGELNTSGGKLMDLIGAQVMQEDGKYVYNVSQEFNTNKTIFGMRIWPYGMQSIFGETALNYSITFLATGEVKMLGPLLEGGSMQKYYFQDAWFNFTHVSYSDGVVVYQFYSSVMEDYLS